MRWRSGLVVSFVLATGCSIAIPEGTFACATTADCPDNWTCRNELCFSDAGTGGSSGVSGQAGSAGTGGSDGSDGSDGSTGGDSHMGDPVGGDTLTGDTRRTRGDRAGGDRNRPRGDEATGDSFEGDDAPPGDPLQGDPHQGDSSLPCGGAGYSTFWPDADIDGYGNGAAPTLACSPPAGHVSNDTDCNDNRPDINPGQSEICADCVDNDCSGADANCNDATATISLDPSNPVVNDNVSVSVFSTTPHVCVELETTGPGNSIQEGSPSMSPPQYTWTWADKRINQAGVYRFRFMIGEHNGACLPSVNPVVCKEVTVPNP